MLNKRITTMNDILLIMDIINIKLPNIKLPNIKPNNANMDAIKLLHL